MRLKDFIGSKAFYMQVTKIALPIMAQQFVTSFVNLIDNIMVGQVSQSALTAVSVANRFYMLAASVLWGLSGAAGIFIAQNYGAKKYERCQKFLNLNITLGAGVMAAFTVILFIVPEWTLRLFSKNDEIIGLGLEYVGYAKFTYVPYSISLACIMAMQAIGQNKIQLKVGLVTVFTNTFLNWVLIYGHLGAPAMGVEGAALATLIARLLEMSVYIFLLVRKNYFYRLDLKGLAKLDFSLFKSMLSKAIPLTANEVLFQIGTSLVFKSYMRIDELLVAAISIVDTVMNIAFIVFGGLSASIAIFIGGKLGSGKLDEARDDAKKIIAFGIMIGVFLASLLFIAAPFIHNLYDLSIEAQGALKTMIRIKSCLIPIYVVTVCTFFVLRAGGDAVSTLIMDSGFLYACPVLISTVLSVFTEIDLVSLYIATESLEILKMFFAIMLFKKGRWVKNLAEN
ncbi:MAG: MATE family efflux transporter [Clostridia bacterium]|nr:MATE family efflux transporter [Clostridia bacterium]